MLLIYHLPDIEDARRMPSVIWNCRASSRANSVRLPIQLYDDLQLC